MFTEIIQAEYKKQMLAMCESLGIEKPEHIYLNVVCGECDHYIEGVDIRANDEEWYDFDENLLSTEYHEWWNKQYYDQYDLSTYFDWWMRDFSYDDMQLIINCCDDIDLRD